MGRGALIRRSATQIGRVLRGWRNSADGFAAFLSYSSADEDVAAELQVGVQRFATPWFQPQRVRLFRDDAVLTASSALWPALSDALTRSDWLIVLASPAAAASTWVNDEIRWWLEQKSINSVVLVLAAGEAEWRDRDFDPDRSSAIPDALRGAFSQEPRWVDLRAARRAGAVGGDDPRWTDGVADVAAAVQGVSKDEIVGEHVREQRRTTRVVRATAVTLAALLLVAVAGGVFAWQQRGQAVDQTRRAEANLALARADQARPTDPSLAAQLVAVAHAIDPTPETAGSVIAAQGAPLSRELPSIRTDVSRRADGGLPSFGDLAATQDGTVVRADYDGLQIDRLPNGRSTFVPLPGAQDVATDPAGRLLAATSLAGIHLYDLRSPSGPHDLGLIPPSGGAIDALAVDRDGTRLVAVGVDGLQTWDVHDPHRPIALPAVYPGGDPRALPEPSVVAISPDGRTIATGGDDGVRLWQPGADGRPTPAGAPLGGARPDRSTLAERASSATGPTRSVAFSPGGRLLASGGDDGTVRLWLTAAPDRATAIGVPLRGHTGAVVALAFDPESSPETPTLYSGSTDRTLRRWDIGTRIADLGGDVSPTGPPFAGHAAGIATIAVTGDAVASSDSDGVVRVWPTDRRRAEQKGPVRFAADGRALISVGGGSAAVDSIGADTSLGPPATVRVGGPADVAASNTLLAVVPSPRPGNPGGGPVELVDIGSPQWADVGAIPTALRTIIGIRLDPSGRFVVVQGAGPEPTTELWDVSTRGTPRRIWLRQTATAGGTPAFDGMGTRMALSRSSLPGGPGDTELWTDPRSASPARTVPAAPDAVGAPGPPALSPDGRILVTADQVPDGRGGTAGRLTFWDTAAPTTTPLSTLLTGQRGAIAALAFDTTGSRLAAGADDGSIRLIDMTGAPAPAGPALNDESGPVQSLEFSPDGQLLASGSNTLRLWRLSVDDLVRDICSTAGSIDPADWARNLPSLEYRPVC